MYITRTPRIVYNIVTAHTYAGRYSAAATVLVTYAATAVVGGSKKKRKKKRHLFPSSPFRVHVFGPRSRRRLPRRPVPSLALRPPLSDHLKTYTNKCARVLPTRSVSISNGYAHPVPAVYCGIYIYAHIGAFLPRLPSAAAFSRRANVRLRFRRSRPARRQVRGAFRGPEPSRTARGRTAVPCPKSARPAPDEHVAAPRRRRRRSCR